MDISRKQDFTLILGGFIRCYAIDVNTNEIKSHDFYVDFLTNVKNAHTPIISIGVTTDIIKVFLRQLQLTTDVKSLILF